MRIKIYLFGLILFMLSACGISTDAPVDNKEPIKPTKIFTPIPSNTSKPTQIVEIPKTPTPTISPEHLSFLATREALIDKFANHCERPALESIGMSPSKQWITLNCLNDNGYSIKLISADELSQWELSYFDLYGSKHDSLEGYIYVEAWSKDNKYVYIATRRQIDGPSFAFLEASALYRLDLDTGQVAETLSNGYYSIGFSPNDRRLAYFDLHPTHFSLTIRDMRTGSNEILELDPKYNYGGDLLWSSDSQRIIFSVAQWNDTDSYIVSVLLWDKDQKTTKTLIDSSDIFLVPIEWISETKVVLESRFTASSSKYELDLRSNLLTLITP